MDALDPAPDPSSEFPAHIVRLDSGLTVVHQAIEATPVAVADVWVRAGAIAEPADWMGMAHFLEHMIFKGTDRLLPGVFDQEIESRGGLTNAATSHDYAHFYVALEAAALPQTLPYLAELLLHAAIPADEFVRERAVVLEEIRQADDDPDWLGFQALSALTYQQHAYGRSVLGTPTQLNPRSPEEMRCFHQAHYQPENMTVVITGGISQAATLEIVQQSFCHFPQRSDCLPVTSVQPPVLQGVQRQILSLPRLEQGRLLMAWLGPGIDRLSDACGLDLLTVLLCEGRSSRLVRELREERQWVQAISGSFSLQKECSLLSLTIWLEPQQVERVEATVRDRLSELASQPISLAELARCQRLLCNDYAFSTETPSQLAGLYGYYGTIAQSHLAVQYPRLVQAHTPESLRRLAATYLSAERYAAVELRPA